MLPDVRTVPIDKRHAAANQLRGQRDFAMPELTWFNSRPCPAHTSLEYGCRRCGIRLRKHQRVGAAWLYLRGRGMIADQVGTGKTAQAAGLLAILKQVGELDDGRAVIIVRPSVLGQWVDELRRFLPQLTVVPATGTRKQRIDIYCHRWDILVVGFQMFVRDQDLITDNFPVTLLVADDIDALRNPTNSTAYAIKRLARRSRRSVVLTATPFHKQLPEMHSVLEVVGGLEVFGSATNFRRHYVREEHTQMWSRNAGRVVHTRQVVGYQNLDDFKEKVSPMCLRRTAADIDDVDLPTVIPNTVWLDLLPAQRDRYESLRRGVLQIIKAEGATVKHAKAAAQFVYGQQICAGLATIGENDGPGTSVKLDWILDHLDGDLSGEKIVIFAQFTNTIQALTGRLDAAGIGHATIWGRQPDKRLRAEALKRFWDDGNCRVLMGTSAIEQGLNLQVARHMVNIDQLMNPARMQQLAGRIRRVGSAYKSVYIHNLLTRNTQEEGYLDLLQREQALADHVWDEANALYEALSPLALLQLIGRHR